MRLSGLIADDKRVSQTARRYTIRLTLGARVTRMRRRKRRDEEPPVETVAARIRKLRNALGWTQQELAVAMGAAVQSVSRWESEQSGVVPQRMQRRALAAVLGVSVEYLMTGEERPALLPPPTSGGDRRHPVLQPLRDIVGQVQAVGEDVLADFVSRVVRVAREEGFLRSERK